MNPEPRPEKRPGAAAAACAVLFAAVAFIIYLPSLHGPFVYDDVYYILENPLTALGSLSAEGLVAAAATRRPMTTLTFALNHLAGGYNTFGFHVANTAIHAMAAFFLLLLARTTLNLAGKKAHADKAAFFAALIFLCHPLATQSVSYISQRANTMCAMFFILSMLFFARGRLSGVRIAARLFYAASAAAGLLAVMSKENAAMLPVLIFLYEWIFFRKGDTGWLKALAYPAAWGILLLTAALSVVVGRGQVHPAFLAAAVIIAPLALYAALAGRKRRPGQMERGRFQRALEIALTISLVIVAAAVWAQARPWATIMHEYKNIAPVTCWQRLLTESRVVLVYLRLYVFPFPGNLSLSHDISVSTGVFSPFSTFVSLAAVAALLAFAFKTRRKRPLLSFAIFMYFGNLAIESTVYPLDLVFEHRAYLPMTFLALPFTAWAAERFPRRSTLALLLISAFLGFFTFQRNMVWADDLTLWRDAAQKAPNDAVARNNMGIALVRRDRTSEAVAMFTAAMQRNRMLMDAPYNLGLVYREKGRFKEAETMFRQALAIRDDYVFAHNDLGLTLMDQGRDREAELHFRKALAWNPYFAKAMNNLGTLLLKKGARADAAKQFRNALSVAPGFAQARINLGIVLLQQGKTNEAVETLKRAVKDDPENAEAAAQLGNALLHAGDAAKAVRLIRKAVALEPGNADARNSLAVTLTSQGRNLEAIVEYEKALALMEKDAAAMKAKAGPGSYSQVFLGMERAAVHKNLALTLFRMKQLEPARLELLRAVALAPNDPDARLGLGSVLAAQGLNDEALEVFSEAARDFPENPQAFVDLGRVLVAMNRPHEALTAFSRAAVLAPGSKEIYRDLEIARDLLDKEQVDEK